MRLLQHRPAVMFCAAQFQSANSKRTGCRRMALTMTNDDAAPLRLPTVFWVICAVCLASIPIRITGATPDISWLIDMCERIFNGEIAYIDIFETTPPIPALLYMPGVLIEKAIGLPAEGVVYAYTYLTFAGVLWLSWLILPRQIKNIGDSAWTVILPSAIFLFLISHDCFSQREAFAAALMLPILSLFIRFEQEGEWAPANLRVWAAILCGLAAAIKPPLFALPSLVLGGYLIIKYRSIRPIYSSGLIISALTAALLTGASLIAFPAYLDGVVTLMREIYVPARTSVVLVLFSQVFMVAIIGAVLSCFLATTTKTLHAIAPAALIALSFGGVFVSQGKFFPYHALPAAFFSFIAIWMAIWSVIATHHKIGASNIRVLLAGGLTVCAAAIFFVGFKETQPTISDRSWAKNLDQPTALAISPGIAAGFPLARQIDAQWIDRIHSQWVIHYANAITNRPDTPVEMKNRFQHYYDSELSRTIALIENQEPDIIIHCVAAQCNWLTEAFLSQAPDLFEPYEVVMQDRVFQILQRSEQGARITK